MNGPGLEMYRRRNGLKILFFVIYLIFGLYFVNSTFSFVQIPEGIASFNNWIDLIGGILILVGGVNLLRASRRTF